MLVGLPFHFLLLLKKFSAYRNTTEGIKQRFEQTYYMIYGLIQNVLAIGITGKKNRRSGQPNCTFLSRQSSKRKNEIPIKSFRRNG